jgi:hypothetical protein
MTLRGWLKANKLPFLQFSKAKTIHQHDYFARIGFSMASYDKLHKFQKRGIVHYPDGMIEVCFGKSCFTFWKAS